MNAPAEPSTPPPARPRIVIAGATGYVGRALVAALVPDHDVIALTRDARGRTSTETTTWRSCDLFSLRDAEAALAGADAAFYLVHSMMPSARLTQGRFDDMDLICADNFARAAKSNGLRHIVYLGGLLPPPEDSELSRHLESRHEVEVTLGSHGVPVTSLRAGLVVGAGGSSFEMMARLVGRLPIMVGPRWMRSKSQAVALSDVITLLRFALAHPELAGKAYDIGCPDVLSYADTLRVAGSVLGRHTRVLTLPVRTAKLSLLWVTVITGTPSSLVRPLVESLQHDLVARDGMVLAKLAGLEPMPLREAIARAVAEGTDRAVKKRPPQRAKEARAEPPSHVRSVQRLPLPPGRDATWVAKEYMRWLPQFMAPILRVDVDEEQVCRFYIGWVKTPLLVLAFAPERSTETRQLFRVRGGLLTRVLPGTRPRLEFRAVLDGKWILAAIHDFVPSLPWYVYTATQAIAHLWVMNGFRRHLESLARRAIDVREHAT